MGFQPGRGCGREEQRRLDIIEQVVKHGRRGVGWRCEEKRTPRAFDQQAGEAPPASTEVARTALPDLLIEASRAPVAASEAPPASTASPARSWDSAQKLHVLIQTYGAENWPDQRKEGVTCSIDLRDCRRFSRIGVSTLGRTAKASGPCCSTKALGSTWQPRSRRSKLTCGPDRRTG